MYRYQWYSKRKNKNLHAYSTYVPLFHNFSESLKFSCTLPTNSIPWNKKFLELLLYSLLNTKKKKNGSYISGGFKPTTTTKNLEFHLEKLNAESVSYLSAWHSCTHVQRSKTYKVLKLKKKKNSRQKFAHHLHPK